MAFWEDVKIWWKRSRSHHAVVEVREALQEELHFIDLWREVHEKDQRLFRLTEIGWHRINSGSRGSGIIGMNPNPDWEIDLTLKNLWYSIANLRTLVALLDKYTESVGFNDKSTAQAIAREIKHPVEVHTKNIEARMASVLSVLKKYERESLESLDVVRMTMSAYNRFRAKPTPANAAALARFNQSRMDQQGNLKLATPQETELDSLAKLIGAPSMPDQFKNDEDWLVTITMPLVPQQARRVLLLNLDSWNSLERLYRYRLSFVRDLMKEVYLLKKRYENALGALKVMQEI